MKHPVRYSSRLDLLTARTRQAAKFRIALLQAAFVAGLVTAGPVTAQVELPVSAKMDLYRAGGYNDGSDGIAPAVYSFEARAGRTLHFSSASGSWTCSTAIAEFTADGLPGAACYGADISNVALPLSGYNLTDFAGALAGVFLGRYSTFLAAERFTVLR